MFIQLSCGTCWGSSGNESASHVVLICPFHPALGARKHLHALHKRIQSSINFLLVQSALQPAKGVCLLFARPQGWCAHSPGPDLIASLPLYPTPRVSFLQPWLYRRLSASLQLLLVKIVPHVDIFLMCLWGKVSSTSSYSTVLI